MLTDLLKKLFENQQTDGLVDPLGPTLSRPPLQLAASLPGMRPIVPLAKQTPAQRLASANALKTLVANQSRETMALAKRLAGLGDFTGRLAASTASQIADRWTTSAQKRLELDRLQRQGSPPSTSSNGLQTAAWLTRPTAPPSDPFVRLPFTRKDFQEALDNDWLVVKPKNPDMTRGWSMDSARHLVMKATTYFDGKKWVTPPITASATPSDIETRNQNNAYEQAFYARQHSSVDPTMTPARWLGNAVHQGLMGGTEALAALTDPFSFAQDPDWQRGLALRLSDGYDQAENPYVAALSNFAGGALATPATVTAATGYTIQHPQEVIRETPQYVMRFLEANNVFDPRISGPEKFSRALNLASTLLTGPKLVRFLKDPLFNKRLGTYGGMPPADVTQRTIDRLAGLGGAVDESPHSTDVALPSVSFRNPTPKAAELPFGRISYDGNPNALVRLAEAAMGEGNRYRWTSFAVTSPKVRGLLSTMGVDPNGFKHVIESGSIRHAIAHHGNALLEGERGQIALTPEHFAKLPEVLSNPDRVYRSRDDATGVPGIVYEKRINGHIVYVETIRTGHKSLALKTMWIDNARP